MEFNFTLGKQKNGEVPLLFLDQLQSLGMRRLSVWCGVSHSNRSASSNLESVVHRGARSQQVRSKAGCRVIDFKLSDCLPCLIFNVCSYPVAFATADWKKNSRCTKSADKCPVPEYEVLQLPPSFASEFPSATEFVTAYVRAVLSK